MRGLILLFTLVFSYFSFGQNCDCKSDFEWVKKTFEENDAGFSIALEREGETAYTQHNLRYLQRVSDVTNSLECTQILYEWLTFFRSGHIAIRRINQSNGNESPSKEPSDRDVLKQFNDWEKFEIDLNDFMEYTNSKTVADFEGIWQMGNYKIGVKQVDELYIGFIIEADGVYWTAGQVKFRIHPDEGVSFYIGDHSEQHFTDAALVGNNILEIGNGFFSLKRVDSKFDDSPEIDRHLKAISSEYPFFEQIDSETNYLMIPSFSASEKSTIDSVISVNRPLILSTPNLIIDLRNNGGGSDMSFQELVPLIYTNPYRSVGVEYFSTTLNNQRMLDFMNDPVYSFSDEEKIWAQESYDKLSSKLGQFVRLEADVVDLIKLDTVYPLPRNIGIIINENNASTTEEFLLFAKQSRKVKLFGRTTFGALDISNMYFVEALCGEFELGYCLSRSLRIPGMQVDEIGIQPDYFLDKGIPNYEWIDFVKKTLNDF